MSVGRSPRCIVLVNGTPIIPVECNIHQSIHQSADTFYAKLPLTTQFDEAYWSDTAPIKIEIRGTNDIFTSSKTQMFIGNADRPYVQFNERLATLNGRDLTAKLAEKNAINGTDQSELWRNKTNQQVITDLAQQGGLSVAFNGADSDAGLQFDQDTSEIADSDSAWNMIVALARKAGCIAFVRGTVLFVQPIDAVPPNGFVTVTYRRPQPGVPAASNAYMLAAARNVNLAKSTTTTIKTVRHKQGDVLTSSFHSKVKNASSDVLIYQHRAANLTKTQQDKIALSHLKETLSHEREIDVTNFPGDVNVAAGVMGLTLKGTGTAWDQDYILSDVVHQFSNDGGYTMNLTAHSQDNSRGEPTQLQ